MACKSIERYFMYIGMGIVFIFMELYFIFTFYMELCLLISFFCLMAYQLFLCYLMPKPFSSKNSSGAI